MREDTLFQFVGFETTLNLDDFTAQWENFARKFFKKIFTWSSWSNRCAQGTVSSTSP